MIKFKYFIYLLVIILLLELITDSLSLIRLLQIFNTVLITRFFIIIPFVFMSLVILIYLTKIKFNFISVFIFFMMYYGVFLSMLHWQNTDSLNYSKYYLTTEFISIFSAFFAFLFVSNINFNERNVFKSMEKIIEIFSVIILLIGTINVLSGYMLSYLTSYTIYLSISGKFLLIPIAWFLLTDKNKSFLFTFLIVLLGGKMGVFISSIAMTVFIIKYKYKIKSFYFILFFIFSIICLILFLFIIKDFTGIGIIDKINGNYNIFNVDSNNIITFGAGRLNEVFSVFDSFTFINYLFGKGIGFEYLDITNGLDYIHNVHISPFGLISKFGLIVTFSLYMFIFYLLFKKDLNSVSNKMNVFFKSIVIGMLIFSLTEYSFFINLILWISLGYLANTNRKKICVEL